MPETVTYFTESLINSFQAKKSQYSLCDNPDRRYLPKYLTLSKMHEWFLQEYHIDPIGLFLRPLMSIFVSLDLIHEFLRSYGSKMKATNTQEESHRLYMLIKAYTKES
ncbi:hypothetical protein PR048_018283 [Dryococelus australis]|uniref:Uncharacterized protein n=1 Tax=Dryococelus australis TaxID=614101 RepID=A0ABQ9HC11_9NEOP|nr:hypothetical protein PR048_018283 [Dryococelus australis]